MNENEGARRGRHARTGRRGLRALIALIAGFTLAIGGVPAAVNAADATSTDIVITKRVVAQPLGLSGSIGADDTLTAGSVFRLHAYTTVAAGPGAAIADDWATCTITAGGSCLINVPQTQVGGANNGLQFWVVEETTAPGTYSNPMLRLGNVSGPVNNLYYPGLTLPMTPNTVLDMPRITVSPTNPALGGSAASQLAVSRSFGAFAGSLDNPTIGLTCAGGLRIAIQMDLSASLNAQQREQFRQALVGTGGLFDALTGTDTSVAVFSFNDTSPAGGNTNQVVPLSVDTQRDLLNAAVVTTSTGASTNWDRALRIVAENNPDQNYDALLFITDGAPNNISAANGTGGVAVDAANVALRSLEAAIYSANAVKAQGVRMVTVGVGAGILGATENLRAVSGPTGGLDYFQTEDWNELTQQLANLAQALTCQIPVTATKYTTDAYGQDPVLADGWDMTLEVSNVQGTAPVTATVTPDTPTQATGSDTNATGTANWAIAFDQPDATATVTLTETMQDGFLFGSGTCTVIHGATGQSTSVTLTGPTVSLPGVSVATGDRVECEFFNQPPVVFGQFQVTKSVVNEGGVPFTDTFTGTWTCTDPIGGVLSGAWSATSTTPSAVIGDIPLGSTCSVAEDTPANPVGGEWGPPVVDPTEFVVTSTTETVAVTVTNTLTQLFGQFQVTKTVVNEGQLPFTDSFTGTWTCTPLAGPALSGTWSATSTTPSDVIADIPVGSTCSVAEDAPTALPGTAWATPVITPAQFEITSTTETVAVTVTNTLTEFVGQFEITKVVANPNGVVYTDAFTGTWTCTPLEGDALTGNWAATSTTTSGVIGGIPVGSTCSVAEDTPANPVGGEWGLPVVDPTEFEITSTTETVAVTVTNTLTQLLGQFQVTKSVVNEGGVPFTDSFTGTWTCTPLAGPVLSGTWSATSTAPSAVIGSIPVGSTCSVAEDAPANPVGGTWGPAVIDPAQFEITSTTETVAVTVTNTLTQLFGQFEITKVVANPNGVTYTDAFAGTWECTPLAGETLTGTWQATSTTTSGVIGDIPVGSVCTVTETKPSDPSGAVWQTPSISPATFTVESATTVVDVTVTNTLAKHLPPTGGEVPSMLALIGGFLLLGGVTLSFLHAARRRRA